MTLLAFLDEGLRRPRCAGSRAQRLARRRELVLKRYFHIGFAADTPQGLVVPVVRDADQKGVLEIARETAELASKAREGKLAAADMQGGMLLHLQPGRHRRHRLHPHHQCARGRHPGRLASVDPKPVWDGEAFAPRLMLPLSLSYDHRVVDGATGRPLHDLPRTGALRPAAGDALAGSRRSGRCRTGAAAGPPRGPGPAGSCRPGPNELALP